MKSVDYVTALTIAGFDPSAGAGILADLNTFSAHGVISGRACITGLTVQSTAGVKAAEALPAEWISRTLAELSDDNSFDVIKIGALFASDVVGAVGAFLSQQSGVPVVFDPVMTSTSGAQLLDLAGIMLLREQILPNTRWMTPNWSELAVLTGSNISSRSQTERASAELQANFPQMALVVTGGDQESTDDLLIAPGHAPQWIAGFRVETTATHGTGCTFSSALAARLALFPDEVPAARVAACKRYVEGAMREAKPMGRGPGPLNHFWECCFPGKR